jgi:hypothetical protein
MASLELFFDGLIGWVGRLVDRLLPLVGVAVERGRSWRMSSSMLVNLCLLMDGGGFANNSGLRADWLSIFF